MARTKNQASAGRTESARRSGAVNGGAEGRFDTRFDTTVEATVEGSEAISTSGSDRDRRAARRRRTGSQQALEATMGQESGQVAAAVATEETVNDGNEVTTREQTGNEQSNQVPVHTERRGIEAAVSGGMGGDLELSTG